MTANERPLLIPAAGLAAFGARLLAAGGCSEEEARRVADRLIMANLTGHDSHGVARIPRYVGMIESGLVVPGQHVTVVNDGGSFVLLEGGAGFGQTLGEEAVAIGCERARDAGISVIGLRNSGHLGRIGDWAEEAAAAGFISIHLVNARGRSIVAPFGTPDRRMSTSPFCIGVPWTNQPPLILDFATSMVAEGKVMVAAAGGPKLPAGALVTAEGLPTTDPAALYGPSVGSAAPDPMLGEGALAVFGGHKGSGLNFMIEILAGALTGSGVNRTLREEDVKPFANGMLSIYLDPERFAGRAAFEAQVKDYADYVRSARPAPGHAAVLLPGDKERGLKAERERDGLPLAAGTWRGLVELGQRLGVDPGDLRPRSG
ncbi:MAG: malate/lactate/ureidoglycolate dehydrogenase [Geminicoccaceae bacterium]|nr:malate/lactate/ureidoglycolate dehydrogenase [Geminicoccaceae bacterium]